MATNKQKGVVAIQKLLCNNGGSLSTLYQRSSELQIYNEKLKAKLLPPLCDHFMLANIDQNTLTVHTDSPAWAAKLRFKSADILDHARNLCAPYSPRTIRIKVVPPECHPETTKRTIDLSRKNSQLILDAANSITDPVLRAALIRLSKHKP